MLLNSFFKIINIQSAEKHIVSIELNANHEIYKGHFPSNPVTPGVCLTQMVKETIEHILGKKLRLITGDNLKFTAVLNPTEHPNPIITFTTKIKENGVLQVDSAISAEGISFFTMKAGFEVLNNSKA